MRYASERPFPAYAFLPGRDPHPTRDSRGHSYSDEPEPPAGYYPPEHWAENEDFLGMHYPEGPLLTTKGVAACIADGVSAASAAREASESAVRSFLTDYFETPESWQVKTSAQRVLSAPAHPPRY